jgi:hypothetical protein
MQNNDPQWHEDGGQRGQSEGDERFAAGFIDGFSRAREIFWRDLMRRAGECKLMYDNTDSESLKESVKSMEAAYRNGAELIARSHTMYPGALRSDSNIGDENPSYTISYDDLYKY